MTLLRLLRRLGQNNIRIERREGGNEIGGYVELYFIRIDIVCFVMVNRYRHFYRSKIFLDQLRNCKPAQVVIFGQIRKALSCVFFLSVRMEQLGSHWMEYR